MAFSVPTNSAWEFIGSRRGRSSVDDSTKIDYIYNVNATSKDLEDVMDYLDASGAPTEITDPVKGGTLYRDEVDWEPIDNGENYRLTLTFADADRYDSKVSGRPSAVGEYLFSASTTGGTVHVTNALELSDALQAAGVNGYSFNAANFPAPDVENMIELDSRDGSVKGIDLVVPQLRWTITYRQAKATITDAYVRTVESVTGTVNDDTFFSRPAGEVLFLGADLRQGTKSDPVVDYHFVRSPNRTGITIGDMTGIEKKGHEHLWVTYEMTWNATGKGRYPFPMYAYVQKVYEESDFANLGIGT